MKKRILGLIVTLAASAAFSETYYLKSNSGTNRWLPITNAWWWETQDGTGTAGADGDPLGASDTFVVDRNRALCTANSNASSASKTFTGKELILGNLSRTGGDRVGRISHYAGSSCVTRWTTIVMRYASYAFENAAGASFTVYGDLTVEGTSALPCSIYNNSSYRNQSVTWHGDWSAASTDAYLRFGSTSARADTQADLGFRFLLDGSAAAYLGTLELMAPTPTAAQPDFRSYFGLSAANASFGGTIVMNPHTALTTPGNAMTIANLTVGDNAAFEVRTGGGSTSSYTVTGAFTQSGTARIVVPDASARIVRDGSVKRHAVLRVPHGAGLAVGNFALDAAGADAALFSLETDDDGTYEYLYLKQVALNPEFVISADAGNNAANPLVHANLWLDADDQPSGGADEPLSAGRNYIIARNRRIATPNSTASSASVALAGALVQIGNLREPATANRYGTIRHLSGQDCKVDFGSAGLHFQNGMYELVSGDNAVIRIFGDLYLENDADHIAKIVNDSRYRDRTAHWHGSLKGGAGTVLTIGSTGARDNAADRGWTTLFHGTEHDFAGRIDVITPTTKTASDYEVTFGIGGTLAGEITLADEAVLTTPTNALAVAKLTLSSNNALAFVADGKGGYASITVTEALTLPSDRLEIRVPDLDSFLVRDGYTHDFRLLKAPVGTGLSDETVEFVLGDSNRSKFSVDVTSDAEGEYVILSQTETEIERRTLTSDGSNGYNLCNAYYWEDAVGNRVGESGDPLPASYEYLIDSGRVLRTPNSNAANASQTFTGFRLVVGRAAANSKGSIWHYSGGGPNGCLVNYGGNGLSLGYGDYQFNNGHRCNFYVYGDIGVDNDAQHPARIYNASGLKDQKAFWSGNLSGSSGSRLRIGSTVARSEAADSGFTFTLLGDAYDFMGTMEIEAPTPTAAVPDFRTTYIQGGQFGGTLSVGAYATLSAPTTTLEIADLVLADHSRLEFLGDRGELSQFVVDNTLTIGDGTVEIAFGDADAVLDTTGVAPDPLTLLIAPLGTGLEAGDFEIAGSGAARRFCRLSVTSDSTFEYLQLEQDPVVTLVASDVAVKDHESGGVVPPSAFETAASWSDGRLPHAGAHYYLGWLGADTFARTPQSNYEFPGDSLTIGAKTVLLQCCTELTVERLTILDRGIWHAEQGVTAPYKLVGTTLDCPSGTAYIAPYNAKEVQIGPAITGAAQLCVGAVWGGTSRPDSQLSILGSTTGFTGTFRFGRYNVKDWIAASEVAFENRYYARNGNFAAALGEFDWKAMEVGCYTAILPRGSEPVTFAGNLNRGLYINARTVFNCDNTKYGTFTIDWPLTVNHGFSKTGPGTLALGGGAAKFIDALGNRGDTPVDGKNTFAISNGLVRVTAADTLNGVAVTMAGGQLEVAIDGSDATHLRYGLRNTRTATPFAVDGLAKLPLTVSVRNADGLPASGSFTLGYLTVASAAANAVRALLPTVAVPVVPGCRVVPTEVTDPDTGDVTFGFACTRRAMVLLIR